MDRLDAMKVFVVALDEGSLAAAGRKLGRSPAAVSRAIAFLEARLGAELLHRTTRSIKLSEEGERYAATCRRVLTELEEIDVIVGGERAVPRGTLTLTAPTISGEMVLRPILDAFLDAYPTVSARLILLDRAVNLIEEGIDVALRIGNLADFLDGGDARRRGAPGAGSGAPVSQAASAHQRAVRSRQAPDHRHGAHSQFLDLFAGAGLHGPAHRSANTASCAQQHPCSSGFRDQRARGCAAVLVSGRRAGPARESSRSCWPARRTRRCPCMSFRPQGRLSVPRVRAFMDFAAPRLRKDFARLAKGLSTR